MSEREDKAKAYFAGDQLEKFRSLLTGEGVRSYEANVAATEKATGKEVTRATDTVIAMMSVVVTAVAKSGMPMGAATALVGIIGSTLGAYTALYEVNADKASKYDGLNK